MTRQVPPPPTRRERRELERRDRPIRDRSRSFTRRPTTRPAWQSPLAIVSVAAFVVAVVLIVLNQKPAQSPSTTFLVTPPISYSIDIVDGEALGRADVPVVMEVWSDFQCPVCAKFVREQFATLKSQFVDAGILRIQARDIAILGTGERDESLELATGAACAARQDRYWTFHDLVLWNQGRENQGDHSPEFLAAVADRTGVDRTAWDACMAADDVRKTVKTQTIAALRAGINATPTIALNGGTPIPGLPDASALIATIQELVGAGAGSTSPVPSAGP